LGWADLIRKAFLFEKNAILIGKHFNSKVLLSGLGRFDMKTFCSKEIFLTAFCFPDLSCGG